MRARLSPVALLAALTFATLAARADGGADANADADANANAKLIDYSYEIENLEAYPDQVFVAWPRTCGSKGDPLGAVSLELNPDWATRLHDVDYEVLVKGKHHELLPYCVQTTRIHALPVAAFPRATRVATADDAALGMKAGESHAVLPALDAIDLPKRIAFFASDSRKVSSPFRFDAATSSCRGGSLLKAVHQDLVIDGTFSGTNRAFTVRTKDVKCTYDPPASGADANANANADADAGADAGTASAGADAGTASATVPTAGDLGTRWVLLAAIGGIVAGGAIAQYRKKRASK